jgi:PTH2 family peptidyl-tRNA hydrolase
MRELKQVLVMNSDIEMTEGKKIAQACHASVKAYRNASSEAVEEWEAGGSRKIALQSDKLEELRREAQRASLPHALVKDAGRTQLESGTVTALGIGPAGESKIDSITGELELIP